MEVEQLVFLVYGCPCNIVLLTYEGGLFSANLIGRYSHSILELLQMVSCNNVEAGLLHAWL